MTLLMMMKSVHVMILTMAKIILLIILLRISREENGSSATNILK